MDPVDDSWMERRSDTQFGNDPMESSVQEDIPWAERSDSVYEQSSVANPNAETTAEWAQRKGEGEDPREHGVKMEQFLAALQRAEQWRIDQAVQFQMQDEINARVQRAREMIDNLPENHRAKVLGDVPFHTFVAIADELGKESGRTLTDMLQISPIKKKEGDNEDLDTPKK